MSFPKLLVLMCATSIAFLDCGSTHEPSSTADEDLCSTLHNISSCMPKVGPSTLEVMTWNIKKFPANHKTLCQVSSIIKSLNTDVIAVQEIDSIEAFEALIAETEGWSGIHYNVRGGIEMGYLYKNSEIVTFTDLDIIFPDNRSEFPREPAVAQFTHIAGMEVILINIHLKCCDDGE